MHPFLTKMWAKRKVIALYGLLLSVGWFADGALRDFAVPDMSAMNEPMVHRMILIAFIVFIVLSAIPFVPGAEVGFGLLFFFGGQIAPLVYLGMVGALVASFVLARLVPLSVLAGMLNWLGLKRAADLVSDLDTGHLNDGLNMLAHSAPSKVGPKMLRHRYALLAVALNTPGNSLLGGGGGLAFIAGASRLFPFWHFLALVACAVLPVPLFFALV